jgi:hypothetical protein
MNQPSLAAIAGTLLLLGAAAQAQTAPAGTPNGPAAPTNVPTPSATNATYESGIYATGADVEGNDGGIYHNGGTTPTAPGYKPADEARATKGQLVPVQGLPRRRR